MQIKVEAYGAHVDALEELRDEIDAAEALAMRVRDRITEVLGGSRGKLCTEKEVRHLMPYKGWLFEEYPTTLRSKFQPQTWGKALYVPYGRLPSVLPDGGYKVFELADALMKARVFARTQADAFVMVEPDDLPNIDEIRKDLRQSVASLNNVMAKLNPSY